MESFRIGNLLIPVPIIQGGMGVGVSLSGLASAVANCGGVGVISTVGIGLLSEHPTRNYRLNNINALKAEIAKARNMTKGILGVNIMVALTNYVDLVKTSIEEKVDIIFSGAGLPLDLPKYLENESHTKLVPIVSSARAAQILCAKWQNSYNYLPDAIVVEGPKAGGHLGFKYQNLGLPEYQLESLVPEVIEAIKPFSQDKKIPVIAAGGIYTGKDIYKFIQMGADAVQMGSRFVATDECDAHPSFKEAFLKAKKADIIIIKSPVGMPGRAIKNSYLDKMQNAEKRPLICSHHCIHTCDYLKSDYCIADALVNAQRGDLNNGFVFAGENASKIRKIMPVKNLFELLLRDYKKAESLDHKSRNR